MIVMNARFTRKYAQTILYIFGSHLHHVTYYHQSLEILRILYTTNRNFLHAHFNIIN